MVANMTEKIESNSEGITSPEEETGLQGKSELCINTKHNTTLPSNIVTGVTLKLPWSSVVRENDEKVGR